MHQATSVTLRYRLSPIDEADGGSAKRPKGRQNPATVDDLPYKVELWDEAKSSVEQIIAVTASGSIGFAAYYAATREFPHRYILLRHLDSVLARWNGPGH